MKRDMDLVRKILFAMEACETGYIQKKLNIDGSSREEIDYHVLIMQEAGLLVGLNVSARLGGHPSEVIPLRLTWDGHDFLDACRDEGRWKKAKGVISDIGGASFDVVKMVLIELMKNQATQIIS